MALGVVWNRPYSVKFKPRLGYHYVVDFKNPDSPGLVRRHFYNRALAQVWMDNLSKHPKFKAHMESFVIVPYSKIKDLEIRAPLFILTAKWFDERYKVDKYTYPPGLTDRQKLQWRTKIRRKQVYNQKQYNDMDPNKVIEGKPNLFVTRYVKYYRDNELAFSKPVNCYTKIKQALKREKAYYPREVVMVTNIIRMLDRFYPGHYSRIKVAIKLYKKYRDQINNRISRYRNALFNRGKRVCFHCSNAEAKEELIARGFLPANRVGYSNGSTITSIDGKLIYPTIFGPIDGVQESDMTNVYHEHGKYGLSGHTRVNISEN